MNKAERNAFRGNALGRNNKPTAFNYLKFNNKY